MTAPAFAPAQLDAFWTALGSIARSDIEDMFVDSGAEVTVHPVGLRMVNRAQEALREIDPRFTLRLEHERESTLGVIVDVLASDMGAVHVLMRATGGRVPERDDPHYGAMVQQILNDKARAARDCAPVVAALMSAQPDTTPEWINVNVRSVLN